MSRQVTGGSIANVVCSMFLPSPKIGGKILVDFDIALLSQPSILLGVSIGVICNVVFPEWLITILFAIFLAWCTFKTFKSGIYYWKIESEEVERRKGNYEEIEGPLLKKEEKGIIGIPWMKMGVLVMIWLSFFFLYLLRGNRYGQVSMFPFSLSFTCFTFFLLRVSVELILLCDQKVIGFEL